MRAKADTGKASARKTSSKSAPESTARRKNGKPKPAVRPLSNAEAGEYMHRFVDLANTIINEGKDYSPTALLAGMSLAILSLFQTMPQPRPWQMDLVEEAILNFLDEYKRQAH